MINQNVCILTQSHVGLDASNIYVDALYCGCVFHIGVKEVKYVGNMLRCNFLMNLSCCNYKMSSILNVFAVLNNGLVCIIFATGYDPQGLFL